MPVTSIAIAVPEGMGRRAAIEWAVNHLIRLLDRMDEDDEAQRNAPDHPRNGCAPHPGPASVASASGGSAYQSQLMRRLFTAMPTGGSDAD